MQPGEAVVVPAGEAFGRVDWCPDGSRSCRRDQTPGALDSGALARSAEAGQDATPCIGQVKDGIELEVQGAQ